MFPRPRLILPLLPLAWSALAAAEPVSFEQVRAVFEGKCLECHNPEKTKGKLLMTSREAFLKGGESGTTLVAGDASKSELVRRLTLPKGHDDIMPPKDGPLPAAEIELVRRWVTEGAVWTAGVVLSAKSKEIEAARADL